MRTISTISRRTFISACVILTFGGCGTFKPLSEESKERLRKQMEKNDRRGGRERKSQPDPDPSPSPSPAPDPEPPGPPGGVG